MLTRPAQRRDRGSFLKQVCRWSFLSGVRRSGGRQQRCAKPSLEQLEDRAVPANVVTPHFSIPDFGTGATITSVSSGSWSSASTWSAGRAPVAGDIVAITSGKTITYDAAASPALDSVVIYAGGVLNFRTDISTQLLVTHMQVMEGG